MFLAKRRRWTVLAVSAAITGVLVASARAEEQVAKPEPPRIQMAILLDTSNSMDGLINQARTQLWKIVNEFTSAKLGGEVPILEVGLYEYGNDGLPAEGGHLRMVVPLTSDLDKVSEALFGLTTNGGYEFCGKVIDVAIRELEWSTAGRDLKCIFIAGNEEFTQGDVDYKEACKAAAAKGVTVSTIFCGDHEQGVQTKWQHGAQLADGSYMSVDQQRAVASIATPQDKDLAQLSDALSKTYVPYGEEEQRKKFSQRQGQQDANAAKAAAGAAASRAGFKASILYRNSAWDLVDALEDGKVKLEDLKAEMLPEVMRTMSLDERKAYVAKVAAERKQVQEKIRKLGEDRTTYLAEQHEKLRVEAAAAAAEAGPGAVPAAPAPASVDEAIIDAVREQAAERGFKLD